MTNRIVGILATNNAFSTSDSISVELKHAIQSFLHRLSVHRNMCSYSLMGVLFEQRKRFFSLFRSSWLPIVSIICIFLQVRRSGMETRWYYFVWVKSLLCSLYRYVFIFHDTNNCFRKYTDYFVKNQRFHGKSRRKILFAMFLSKYFTIRYLRLYWRTIVKLR